jgi:uncharacterized protein
MRKKKTRSLRCPTCRTLVLPGEENFPFCSDRCRLIDLGKWATGGYVISTPITDPEQLESVRDGSAADSKAAQPNHNDSTDDH